MPDQPLALQPEYGVLVPCRPEEFVEFISKLLGKPQIAEGVFHGPFDIDITDVENFYHLIEQRLSEQNKGRLVQFTTNISFDDGTSVEVPSLDGIRSYSEVRPIVSTSVILTWVYLVTFANASIPERQQIEVKIDTTRVGNSTGGKTYTVPDNKLSYRITYTARTWGADIENLLKNHLRSLIIPEHHRWRSFVRKWQEWIYGFILLGLYALFLRVGLFVAEWISRWKATKYDAITAAANSSQIDKISRKIDYIYSALSGASFASVVSIVMIYLVISLVICFAICSGITEGVTEPRPSFVRLSRSAEYDKSARLQIYEKGWTTFLATFAFASVAGVAGNILTWFVWG